MKPFVVFIPGIFGTSLLKCGETVWPIKTSDKFKIIVNNIFEKPVNSLFSSDKKEDVLCPTIRELAHQLVDKNLTTGPVTHNYDNIINLIREIVKDNFFIFQYDWRNSINENVEIFAQTIEKLEVGDKDIVIIGHSAGGLIGHKYLASSDKYETENSNFGKVKKFISIGSPLQGCVKALTAILGLLPQNLLTPNETKEILNMEFFKSIYELCPHNIQSLFYHKDTKQPLTSKQIVEILKKNGFPDTELKNFFNFKNDMDKLIINDNVHYLCISGVYSKPMCSSFLADIETGEIDCVYDYGGGDGTVLKEESMLPPEFSFRKHTVLGKHAYLTEIDEVLDIIKKELNMEINKNIILFADVITRKDKQIDFNLYFIKNKTRFYITDLSAEHISFSRKTVTSNITKKITKKNTKKDPSVFSFRTKEKYGFIRFKNLSFFFKNSEDEIVNDFVKYAKVELENTKEMFF
ncbi:hypothetical protein Yalta_113 [Yalta virus]|nr:hypothetical protein Yalta_113 [Yalta virus]